MILFDRLIFDPAIFDAEEPVVTAVGRVLFDAARRAFYRTTQRGKPEYEKAEETAESYQ